MRIRNYFLGSGSGSAEKPDPDLTLIGNEKKKIYLYHSNSSPQIRSFGFIQEFSWMEIFCQSIVVYWICCKKCVQNNPTRFTWPCSSGTLYFPSVVEKIKWILSKGKDNWGEKGLTGGREAIGWPCFSGTVLRIHFILIWIRILGSASWNNGSNSKSDQKSEKYQLFFLLLFFL